MTLSRRWGWDCMGSCIMNKEERRIIHTNSYVQYDLLCPIITNGLCRSSVYSVIRNFHPISASKPVGIECIDKRQHQMKLWYLDLNWIVPSYLNHLAQQTINNTLRCDANSQANFHQFRRSSYIPPLTEPIFSQY